MVKIKERITHKELNSLAKASFFNDSIDESDG